MLNRTITNSRLLSILVAAVLVGVWCLEVFVAGPDNPGMVSQPDAVLMTDGWADEKACLECHEQAKEFFATGHALTLHPANDPDQLKLLMALEESPVAKEHGITVSAVDDRVVVTRSRDKLSQEVRLDWAVGSGKHATTWVTLIPEPSGDTSLLEFRWSAYSDPRCVALTPGQSVEEPPGFFGGLGVLYDAPRTQRCFSCHSSRIGTTAGKPDYQKIHSGVTCQRCHGPCGDHVASNGLDCQSVWKPSDRMDAVRRCAQCHRDVSDVEPETITTTDLNTIRFQPVGLQQSLCFQRSEMKCTTCHDPHRPMEVQDLKGIAQCLQCHSGDVKEHTLCLAGHTDDCLTCHMPKVQLDVPLRLTDHWIRVREKVE